MTIYVIAGSFCLTSFCIMLLINLGIVPGEQITKFFKKHQVVQVITALVLYAALALVFLLERR